MDSASSPRSTLQLGTGTAAATPSTSPEDVIKVLISTDNHLGYLEKDPVRCDDSFRAFEEVLELAKANAVDMLLLAGNLFHDKNPSHKTLVRTMRLLRYHCLSPKGASLLSVRSEPSAVHFTDPCNPVSLPVFVIHGNRDGPAGGAGFDALSPLDVLAQAGLVTYFGRNLSGTDFDMVPILLQKGGTQLALYGQGNVRDEILSDAWVKGRLKWYRREQPMESGEIVYRVDLKDEDTQPVTTKLTDPAWNVFVLHQNRRTAGSPQGVPDAMLPIWMDYVVWGHEHESQPELTLSKPQVLQPGSTVATSLSEGEATQKHAVLLEVWKDCRGIVRGVNRPVPLQAVRALHFEDVSLPSEPRVSETDPKSVNTFLESKINGIVDNQEACFDRKIASFHDGGSEIACNEVLYPPRSFYIEKLSDLRHPLVHLRVEASGCLDPPNPRRFGQRFIGRVASTSEMLSFERPQRRIAKKSGTLSKNDDVMKGVERDGEKSIVSFSQADADEQDVRIPTLVKYFLCHQQAGGTGLSFFELDKLTGAVDKFVDDSNSRKNSCAIPDYVRRFLKEQQERTLSEVTQAGHRLEETEMLAKFESGARDAANRALVDSKPSQQEGRGTAAATDATNPTRAQDEDMIEKVGQSKLQGESIEDKLEDIHAVVSDNPKLAAALAKRLSKSVKGEGTGKDKKVLGKKGSKDSAQSGGRKKGGYKKYPGESAVIELDGCEDEVMIIEDSDEEPFSRETLVVRSTTRSQSRNLATPVSDFDVQKSAEEVDEIEAVLVPSGALRRRRSESGRVSSENNRQTSAVLRRSGRKVTPSPRVRPSVISNPNEFGRVPRKSPVARSDREGPSRKLAATVAAVNTEKNGNPKLVRISNPNEFERVPRKRPAARNDREGPSRKLAATVAAVTQAGSETVVRTKRSLASMPGRKTDAGAVSGAKARQSSAAARRGETNSRSLSSPRSGRRGHAFTQKPGETTARPRGLVDREVVDVDEVTVKIPRSRVKRRLPRAVVKPMDIEHRPPNAVGETARTTERESIENPVERHAPEKRSAERTLRGGHGAARQGFQPFQPTGHR